MMKTITKSLCEIQKKLKAPKSRVNAFGKYKYRSCEDILDAVKKVIGDLVLTITDEIVAVGDRCYVKATATITDGSESLSVSAFAREPLSKKGMDEAQLTGATSSYARKYALNGLFCIDDNQDADAQSPTESPLINENEMAVIEDYLATANVDRAKFLKWLKVSDVSEIRVSEYQKAVNALKAKVA